MLLPRQACTVDVAGVASDPGHAVVQLSQPIRNARRIFLSEVKVEQDPLVGSPAFSLHLEFRGTSIEPNDVNTLSTFVVFPDYDAARLTYRAQWNYPDTPFAEYVGRDVPISNLDVRVRDQSGTTVAFSRLGLRLTVEYDAPPNSATSSSYAYANEPVQVPAVSRSSWPHNLSTVGPPY